MKSTRLFAAMIIGLSMGASAAQAADLPKEGAFDYLACWSGTTTPLSFSKDYVAYSYELLGTIVSTTPGGLFDKTTFRCVGLQTEFKGKMGGGNVCEGYDADGDRRLTQFSIHPDGKVTRETIAATGKYANMDVVATVVPMGSFPVAKPGTIQTCNRQSGTYKMK